MIARLVVVGATGDLMSRYLAPALAELCTAGRLPERFDVVGVGRSEEDDASFRDAMATAMREAERSAAVATRFEYVRGDGAEAGTLREAMRDADGACAFYLALPTDGAPGTVRAIRRAGPPRGSAIAVEKPFGHDLASARALNTLLAESFAEEHVFRVDHFLTMSAVSDLLHHRGAAAGLERGRITHASITWDETLALEGRADYYDEAGALVDMVQNHLLQVLAAVCVAPESARDPASLRAGRADVLRRVRLVCPDAPERCVFRARYEAGKGVPAYAEEKGVDAARQTETFVQLTLRVDDPRFRDVPFVIRTGKALAQDRQEVHIVQGGAEALVVDLNARPRGALSPYASVLDGILRGDRARFVSAAETEAAWEVIEPIQRAFREGRVPLRTYPAGSSGPDVPS